MSHAVLAGTVFDGEAVHRDCAVVIEATRIAGVIPRAVLPAGMRTRALPDGAWLAPGFIDVQVNGGGGLRVSGLVSTETTEKRPSSTACFAASAVPSSPIVRASGTASRNSRCGW